MSRHGRDCPPRRRRPSLACCSGVFNKDPKQRLRDIGDARIELGELSPESTILPVAAKAYQWVAWAAAAAVMVTLIALAGAIFTRTRGPVATPTVMRFQVQAPRISSLGVGPSLALSPDGRSIAFVAVDTTGVRLLHVRGLDSNIVRPFPQVREPLEIAWSPDSRRIAFATGGRELRTVDLAEGTTRH